MDIIGDPEDDQIEEEEGNGPLEHSSEDESMDELMEPNQEMEESPTPSEPDDDAQHFDIALAAQHTYMGGDLERVRSAALVEAGQSLWVPMLRAPGAVFPGELVPLRLPRDLVDFCLRHRPDKLIVLLVPDESGSAWCSVGALCEVEEASGWAEAGPMCLKVRATHRVTVARRPGDPRSLNYYERPHVVRARVCSESVRCSALRDAGCGLLHAGAGAASAWEGPAGSGRARALLASVSARTPWPHFLYEAYSLPALRSRLQKHFRQKNIGSLPASCGALSSWACANAAVSVRARLAALRQDGAAQRLALLVAALDAESGNMYYCVTCGSELARRSDEIAMTTAGVHGHYANPGGYTHDVVTVSRARRLAMAGASSRHYSWFPGYSWRVALCATCRHHKGWRFDAISRLLVPRRFYALCRNYVTPQRPDLPALPAAPGDTPPPPDTR